MRKELHVSAVQMSVIGARLIQTVELLAVMPNAGKAPGFVISTSDLCYDRREWHRFGLVDGIKISASAAIFVLRAHTAQKSNSQIGLEAAIRCNVRHGLLWLENHNALGLKSGPLLGPF